MCLGVFCCIYVSTICTHAVLLEAEEGARPPQNWSLDSCGLPEVEPVLYENNQCSQLLTHLSILHPCLFETGCQVAQAVLKLTI